MPSLLAYCPTCKRSFGANNIFGVAPGAVARNITFQNVGVTCPLGHHGFFLDGTFDLMGNSQRLVAGLWVSQKVTRTARQLLGTTTTRLREATYDYEVLPPEEILYAADLRSSRLAGNRGNPYWCDPVWRETK
jgi:hypothetical protein